MSTEFLLDVIIQKTDQESSNMQARILRWIIAFFTTLFAAVMLSFPPDNRIGAYCYAAFCLCISVVCLFPSTMPVIGRLIGITVFALAVVYLGYEILHPNLESRGPGAPSLLGAIKFMGVIGLPCAYVGITGSFFGWPRKKPPTDDVVKRDI